MVDRTAEHLAALVAQRASAAGASWISAQVAQASAGSRTDFVTAFSSAGRRLGPAPLLLEEDGAKATRLLAGRGLDEVGRVALLLAMPGAVADQQSLVQELFYRGDAREKQAVLRALPLLPEPLRFLEIGVEACRSSVQTVFEAIACENPYPADHFPEAAFNQMVLKALFIETRTARIDGLARRAGSELVRMVEGYASERRAAGRTVPEDIEAIRALVRRDQ
jgi:hypothetical protein